MPVDWQQRPKVLGDGDLEVDKPPKAAANAMKPLDLRLRGRGLASGSGRAREDNKNSRPVIGRGWASDAELGCRRLAGEMRTSERTTRGGREVSCNSGDIERWEVEWRSVTKMR